MPLLDQNTIRRLAAYQLSRDGVDLPDTDAGALKDAACWSWAVAGDFISVRSAISANSVFEAVLEFDYTTEPITLQGINEAAKVTYPGCEAEFRELENNLAAAKRGVADAQDAFRRAMMGIIARQHGLVPQRAAGAAYTLHLKTSSWFGWDHWGIGVRMPDGQRMFIQTVPNVPISFACNVMWDEHQPESVIGLSQLLVTHVEVIGRAPPVPLALARCVTCRQTPRQIRRGTWERCEDCGTAYCPAHAGRLAARAGSHRCGQGGCAGTTEALRA